MCQMCEEYEAELRRMGIIQKIVVSDEVLQNLERHARERGHSVEEEAREVLEQAVAPRLSREEIIERLRRTAAMTPKGVKQTDSTILIREDRDR